MNNQAKKYRYYHEALDLISCKLVSTPRQIKNGTRVYRLPFKDAWGHDIDFATYSSGYVRRLVKLGYCSCYQINKKRKGTRLIKVESGQHKGLLLQITLKRTYTNRRVMATD